MEAAQRKNMRASLNLQYITRVSARVCQIPIKNDLSGFNVINNHEFHKDSIWLQAEPINATCGVVVAQPVRQILLTARSEYTIGIRMEVIGLL